MLEISVLRKLRQEDYHESEASLSYTVRVAWAGELDYLRCAVSYLVTLCVCITGCLLVCVFIVSGMCDFVCLCVCVGVLWLGWGDDSSTLNILVGPRAGWVHRFPYRHLTLKTDVRGGSFPSSP